jgi:D-aminopeptidase
VLEYDGRIYTMGLLVQSNHGVLSDLTVCGRRIGPALAQRLETRKADQGSILAVLATDLPWTPGNWAGGPAHQRGPGRMGSYVGHGSGEVFLAFSTANPSRFRRRTPCVRSPPSTRKSWTGPSGGGGVR